MANLKPCGKVIFAAMSRDNFYLREYIVKFILEQGHTPLSAFMMFSYFLLDSVERQKLIGANNRLVEMSDELWAFGRISEGIKEEIRVAQAKSLPVKYFRIHPLEDIGSAITFEEVLVFEGALTKLSPKK